MRILALILAVASTAAVAQADRNAYQVRDVRVAERVTLGSDVALIPLAIWEDSRCADARLCLSDDRFVIDTMLTWRGDDRKFPMEMGIPYALPGGTLTLVDAGTPANEVSAIRLQSYRLAFVYEPYPRQ